MRSIITTEFASRRNLTITSLIMVSLLAINNAEATSSPVLTINRPEVTNSAGDYAGEAERESSATAADRQMNPLTKTCLMAEQLKDPEVRADYDSIIADMEGTGFNRSVQLDPISMECNACHDGTVAKAVNHRISDGNTHRVKSIETIKGAHPVGMDYAAFARSKEYVPSEILAANIILINGKVGCVSCHNLLGRNEKYLAVDNSGSRLCFSCHYK